MFFKRDDKIYVKELTDYIPNRYIGSEYFEQRKKGMIGTIIRPFIGDTNVWHIAPEDGNPRDFLYVGVLYHEDELELYMEPVKKEDNITSKSLTDWIEPHPQEEPEPKKPEIIKLPLIILTAVRDKAKALKGELSSSKYSYDKSVQEMENRKTIYKKTETEMIELVEFLEQYAEIKEDWRTIFGLEMVKDK